MALVVIALVVMPSVEVPASMSMVSVEYESPSMSSAGLQPVRAGRVRKAAMAAAVRGADEGDEAEGD